MPPPNFAANGYKGDGGGGWQAQNWGGSGSGGGGNGGNGGGGGGGGGFMDQDWLALPLDPLLDQWGADIGQTGMGPDVGGMDMLDILLNMGGPPGSA